MQIKIPEQLMIFSAQDRMLNSKSELFSESLNEVFIIYPLLKYHIVNKDGYFYSHIRVLLDGQLLDSDYNINNENRSGSCADIIVVASGG